MHGNADVEVVVAAEPDHGLEGGVLVPPAQEVDAGQRTIGEERLDLGGVAAPPLQAEADDVDRRCTGVIGCGSGLLNELVDESVGLVLVDKAVGAAKPGELVLEVAAHVVVLWRVPVAGEIDDDYFGGWCAVQ